MRNAVIAGAGVVAFMAGVLLLIAWTPLAPAPAVATRLPVSTPSHTPITSTACITGGAALKRALAGVVADHVVLGDPVAVEFPGYSRPQRAWYVAARVGPNGRDVGVWGTTVDPAAADAGGIIVAVNQVARAAAAVASNGSPLFPESLDARRAEGCLPAR